MGHAWKFGALALLLSVAGALRAAEPEKMPDWVPVFPDVKPTLIENKKDGKEFALSVTYSFTTSKSPAEVKDFYEKGFESAGFKKADFKAQSVNDKDDGVVQENVKGDDGKRFWFISARTDKVLKDTVVSLVYQTKN